ncbi:Trm112 family protein [Kineococcus gynurae]|uniref:Trm112 family protein n=1 Tax=Kineococcus gynurae TaxID=452979 RepID=A0ABV5LRC1_9ACTN
MSGGPDGPGLRLEDWVLPLLRCPVTGAPLSGPVEVDGEVVLTTGAGVRYPVVDGVPVLLADEARGLAADGGGA